MLNNGCNDFLFGVHCVEEGDRIPMLQSYGQALKQKNCFSGVLGDDCGASANLLDYSSTAMSSHVPAVSIAVFIIIIERILLKCR